MSAAENKAVFLSYASQDAEAARRICEALRAAGVEVWFDQSELVGGDAWDAKIRRQISECALPSGRIPIAFARFFKVRPSYSATRYDSSFLRRKRSGSSAPGGERLRLQRIPFVGIPQFRRELGVLLPASGHAGERSREYYSSRWFAHGPRLRATSSSTPRKPAELDVIASIACCHNAEASAVAWQASSSWNRKRLT